MPIIILFSVLSASIFAGTLSVKGHRSYKLNYSEEKLDLKTPIEVMVISKQKCSESIFNDFYYNMKKIELLKSQKEIDGDFIYFMDGKELRAKTSSSIARVIDSMPEYIKKLKIEEKLRCKSKF